MSNSEKDQNRMLEFDLNDTIQPHLLSGEMGALLSGKHGEPTPVQLKALFLGPKGENAELVERLLLQVFRDNVYWRRNFHPEDPPAIMHSEQYSKQFLPNRHGVPRSPSPLSLGSAPGCSPSGPRPLRPVELR